MATLKPNSPDVLSAEILAQARRKCDDIIRRATDESASLVATTMAELDKIRRESREAAQTEAARRKETTLATIPVEAGRLRAERIECILEGIREAVRRQVLARDFDHHETVVTLAAEAIRRMPGTDFILKISAAEHAAFGDRLAEEIRQRTGRSPLNLTITADSAVTEGGVVVESADGFQIWDNRLRSRLERLWPELRRQIAMQTLLVSKTESPEAFVTSESYIADENCPEARQRLGVRQSSGAFTPTAKAAEGCRSPKPGGGSDDPGKGEA
jgi:vacuolar-type H+-ATPase subunit E/Vma4